MNREGKEDPEAQVRVGRKPAGDIVYTNISVPHGYLEARYNPILGDFWIKHVDVDRDYLRQGIGQGLLREALIEARQLRAAYIIGEIVSREALESSRAVFTDEDSVIVKKEGAF